MLTGIAGNDPALQIRIESRRCDLRNAELPTFECSAVHAFDVQVFVFIEGKIEGVQPVDFQHVTVFEGVDQGVGCGSHGSQSLNGKDAMIAQCEGGSVSLIQHAGDTKYCGSEAG